MQAAAGKSSSKSCSRPWRYCNRWLGVVCNRPWRGGKLSTTFVVARRTAGLAPPRGAAQARIRHGVFGPRERTNAGRAAASYVGITASPARRRRCRERPSKTRGAVVGAFGLGARRRTARHDPKSRRRASAAQALSTRPSVACAAASVRPCSRRRRASLPVVGIAIFLVGTVVAIGGTTAEAGIVGCSPAVAALQSCHVGAVVADGAVGAPAQPRGAPTASSASAATPIL